MGKIDMLSLKERLYKYYVETCQHPMIFVLGYLIGILITCLSLGNVITFIIVLGFSAVAWFIAKYFLCSDKYKNVLKGE